MDRAGHVGTIEVVGLTDGGEASAMGKPVSGGGWRAILYGLRTARRVGGAMSLYRALRSRNACKTCALGMGGQRGGMVNELGHFPEVCKKSMQAMAADMQSAVDPTFFRQNDFGALRKMSPRSLEHTGRLNTPIYAGARDDRYHPISWSQALDHCVRQLGRGRPDEHFFYFSGRASNEAAFLWQLFARLYGTNHVNNCSYYCHQASAVGLTSALGTGTATIVLDDLTHCDLFFLIGGNPASNHPRLMTMLHDIRQRGGRVVVINPIRETALEHFSIPSRADSLVFGYQIASDYLQPHIGGDIALLLGIAKRVMDTGGCNIEFIADHTEAFDAFREQVEQTTWDRIEQSSGVDRASIERVGDLYARSDATVFAWTMGITHHVHGSDNVRAIANLAMLRGMVGRKHAGLLPIRGHSNVQGVGSVGVTPKLKAAVFERLESHFGVTLPDTPGLDTLGCIEAMQAGKIKHAVCLGGNLFGSNPDTTSTISAFGELDSVTYLSTTLNTGHAWGRAKETLILPVKVRDEESQPTTQESMFNFVRLSDGGPQRLVGPKSEVELVASIARRVLGDDCPVDWKMMETHGNIRAAMAAIIPGYEAIGQMDRTREEFQIGRRTFHQPTFKTPSGRAIFHATAIPDVSHQRGDLRLMTIRSEGQFNTVVYEEEDLYRGQTRRNVILISQQDMDRMSLQADQRITVCSKTGELSNILVRPYAIRPGNVAMYFPEANVLVSRRFDPESRTPAYKHVAVTLRPCETIRTTDQSRATLL